MTIDYSRLTAITARVIALREDEIYLEEHAEELKAEMAKQREPRTGWPFGMLPQQTPDAFARLCEMAIGRLDSNAASDAFRANNAAEALEGFGALSVIAEWAEHLAGNSAAEVADVREWYGEYEAEKRAQAEKEAELTPEAMLARIAELESLVAKKKKGE